jgi:hypothetical protein
MTVTNFRHFEGRWAVATDIRRATSAPQARPLPHSSVFDARWKILMRVLIAIRRGTPL